MSFTTAGDTGGKYKSTHYHVTSFGWDMNAFYAGKPDGAKNGDYNRTSVDYISIRNNACSSQTSQSRLNWTDDRTINHVQPYIVVFFWRRTA